VKTVFKFEIDPVCEKMIPLDAKILSVGSQGDQVVLWAEVETDNQMTTRKFRGFGTGHEIASDLNLSFIGTVQFQNGMVFHIYEEQ
jgi:hypothetical protein